MIGIERKAYSEANHDKVSASFIEAMDKSIKLYICLFDKKIIWRFCWVASLLK